MFIDIYRGVSININILNQFPVIALESEVLNL